MIYKYRFFSFFLFNFMLISNSYSNTCPSLDTNQLKRLMLTAEANKEGNLHRISSSVSIKGKQYRMKYSETLASALSSVVSSSDQNIKIESTQERSEIQKIEGPQVAASRQPIPLTVHSCKYKVLIPKIVYVPSEEVEIYALK